MHPRIAIVALDINKNHPNFKKNISVSASEQFISFQSYIKKTCEELKKSEPNSVWVIGWSEYGIKHFSSRFIPNELKKIFKAYMQDLTREYPQLIIVAGTIATKKHFNKFVYKEKLEQIKEYYAENKWVQEKRGKKKEI